MSISKTRQKLVDVARQLFAKNGVANTTMNDIAKASGKGRRTLYTYFKSKDELAIQVTQMVDRAYTELEKAYLADKTTSGRDKLLDFVGKSLEISARDEVLYKAFIHGLRYPEQGVLQKSDKRVYYRVLRELVEQCRQEGSIHPSRDPDEIVEELVVLHRGTLFEWRIYQEGFDVARQGRRMADALLRGLQTE